MHFQKYKKFPPVVMEKRTWPDKELTHAPYWCSVDLRDGNQALPIPMNIQEKLEMFQLLLEIGFKEIEVGFPSASETEYNFLRKLADEKLIPDDVTIQVLTQSRKDLIERTFESLRGVKRAVIHLYNSTSTLQRKVVFQKEKKEIIQIAVEGAKLIKELAKRYPETEYIYEYSPESFTGTELDFALEISHAVMDVFEPSKEKKMILNLPATVEMSTPNVYADQIEWMVTHLRNRECLIISLHTHNDRGTSVAATELGLLAGGDRVEGTLFGNGERTGNTDILTIALNLFSQGIDPKLDFSNINKIIKVYEKCMKLPVHPRHPYAGELVYTAFSGSHQDAIKKGLDRYHKEKLQYWEVPYLPIDPADVGREYEAIIRINSQSGKGGVAFIMEQEFGFKLPKAMHPEFGRIIKEVSDKRGEELKPQTILEIFKQEYLSLEEPLKLKKYEIQEKQILDKQASAKVSLHAVVLLYQKERKITAHGNGPIDAFFNGLKELGLTDYEFISYDEHALGQGSDSQAVAYIQLRKGGKSFFGVGVAENISAASIQALVSAVNRSFKKADERG